jgi:uncharacterized protein YbaP (TraB family)
VGRSVRNRLIAALLALAAAPAWAAAGPAVWHVQGAGGGEIWLLGSMHVLRASDHPLPPLVDELHERADVVVMELDLDDLDYVAEQSTVFGAAVLPPGTVLRDVVDEEVYRLTEVRARTLGIELRLLESLEPWVVAITMLDLGMRRIGFQAELGLEQYLVGKSRASGKEIIGLESLETQIGVFDRLSSRAQQALLEQTLRELDSAGTTMDDLATAWREGRLELLSEQLMGDFEQFPGLYETLVIDRNEHWLGELERMLTDGRRYLVVVGALHLVGRDSVIELLEARGHDVTRLP